MLKVTTITLHGIKSDKKSTAVGFSNPADRYTISYDQFTHILNNIDPDKNCTLKELINKKSGNWIVITFDDGLLSDYEVAVPLLSERNLKATFFINPNNIDNQGYLSKSHIKFMHNNDFEIASHGLNHQYLVTLPNSEVENEINRSKILLEDIIIDNISSFAPVGGHFKNWMVQFAESCGYHFFASMIPGNNVHNFRKDSISIVYRNHIQFSYTSEYISNLIRSQKIFRKSILRYRILTLIRNTIGINNYDIIKSYLTSICNR